VGGPGASNQVHPPGNSIAAIPPPLEGFYFWEYTFEQVQRFQPCDAREDGYCYIALNGKVYYCPACITSKSGTSAHDRHKDFCPRSAPFRTMMAEKLKKEGKYIPLVDDHSVQASGTFSTAAATLDDEDSDVPAPKQPVIKWTAGPSLEDSDDDDGKPAAKPAAKKPRALHSLDSALVPLERPLESGPLVPRGPVPPVVAMPLEAVSSAMSKRLF